MLSLDKRLIKAHIDSVQRKELVKEHVDVVLPIPNRFKIDSTNGLARMTRSGGVARIYAKHAL